MTSLSRTRHEPRKRSRSGIVDDDGGMGVQSSGRPDMGRTRRTQDALSDWLVSGTWTPERDYP